MKNIFLLISVLMLMPEISAMHVVTKQVPKNLFRNSMMRNPMIYKRNYGSSNKLSTNDVLLAALSASIIIRDIIANRGEE